MFVAVIFISTLLMIVYFWRVVELMYIRVEGEGETIFSDSGGIAELPAGMLLPGLFLGILSFVIGILWMTGMLHPLLDAINMGFGLGVSP